MPAVVIISANRDFTEVVSELMAHELGLECHSAVDEKEAAQWPDAFAIHDDKRPVRMRELLEKAQGFMQSGSDMIRFGAWELSLRGRTLARGSESVALTDKELGLLKYLHEAGASVAKEELLKQVWGFESNVDTHTLETHIYRLRNKCRELGDEGLIVATDSGYGLKA